MDRTNQEWVEALKEDGIMKEDALADLRAIIIRSLPYGLSKYLSPSSPKFDTLVEETAQETLLRVMDRIDTFEGRSRFTTWVMKIAVRIALSELRRKRWKNVSLEDLAPEDDGEITERILPDDAVGPHSIAEQSDLMGYLQQVMDEELTDYQKKAIQLIGMMDVPMDQAAELLGSNRNAIYKLMHDARLRLKRRMARDGMSVSEFISHFGNR